MLSLDRDKSRTRPPAVAGLFYPENANELRHDVNGYIDECSPRAAVAVCPKALIVPHAGYQYSGPVAGFAYRLLRDWSANIHHVVMIGPSHRVPLRGLAVPSVDLFATPLGDVPVDAAGRERPRDSGWSGSPMQRTRRNIRWKCSCRSCKPCSRISTFSRSLSVLLQ